MVEESDNSEKLDAYSDFEYINDSYDFGDDKVNIKSPAKKPKKIANMSPCRSPLRSPYKIRCRSPVRSPDSPTKRKDDQDNNPRINLHQ